MLEYLQKAQQILILENHALIRDGGIVTDSDSTVMVIDAILRVLSFGLGESIIIFANLNS